MAIAEVGGPSTQAGISYQNSIAALYLGRMLDPKAFVASENVVEVRVEAPEDVDDIVLTFANGTKHYIQAKESVSKAKDSTSAWGKIWRDFEDQFNRSTFNKGQDKLVLWSGTYNNEIVEAKDLSERASTSKSYEEWEQRLTKNLLSFLEHLNTFLSPVLKNDKDRLLSFFTSVEVRIAPRQLIEEDFTSVWMPESSLSYSMLFSLLRDRVGILARIRGSHTIENLHNWLIEENIRIAPSVPAQEVRKAIYSCSSILRHQKNTIGKTGKRLSRNTFKDITKWLLETTDVENIGILLDQAGTGKTVLIQEILEELERQKVVVLAIKADQQLAGVHNLEDIKTKLDLPIRVERIADTLASQKPFVVLIDQIDALSLSMAHDQRAMNVALDMISRLRSIPRVRIVISCRKFDYNSDPRLNNLERCKLFSLEEFSETEVEKCLKGEGIEYSSLLPSTQKLLRTPLHLNLFLMALEAGENKTALQERGFTSLQELYHLVWDCVIMKQLSDAPPAWEREQALLQMAQYMDREQKITVPKSFFTKQDTSSLERAIQWLSSEGIVEGKGIELAFFHQTFFDYCYARDFVQKKYSLSETLLASPQGLFQRPQMVQVLSYLRGIDDQRLYFKQLNSLLKAENLRYHMKNHLYRWLASIPSPTDHEWRLIRRLNEETEMRSQLLQYSDGNPGWFDYWIKTSIPELLGQDEEEGYKEAFGYLHSMIDIRQKEVIEFLLPYYTKNTRLEEIVGNFILGIRTWKCHEAVEMLELVLGNVSKETRFSYYGWEELAIYDYKAVCRILRNLMDEALENYKYKQRAEGLEHNRFGPSSINDELDTIDDASLDKALEPIINDSPLYFIDIFLPWLVSAVQANGYLNKETAEHFIPDQLLYDWYERYHHGFSDVIKNCWVNALVKMAHVQPQAFHEKIEYLSSYPYESIQFLVARVLREVPEEYASLSLKFLMNDPRRLQIGDHENFDSRQLINSISPYLQEVDRLALEHYILTSVPRYKQFKLEGYCYHDRSQLRLLQAITYDNLSVTGKRRLGELERKFPNYRASDEPYRSKGGAVGSPIDYDSAIKMSNRHWLLAMKKYQAEVSHPHWLKGGASELAQLLKQLVINQPHRFIDLFSRCNDQLDQHYICALLNGLVESNASAELLFMAIERFMHYDDLSVRRTIAWAVERRANEEVPEHVIELLKIYLSDQLLYEREYDDDPSSGYLNTVRGVAMRALMRVFHQKPSSYLYDMWAIVCYAARSEMLSLRAGAIYELTYMVRYDRDRALDLFEQAITGHPQLYHIRYTEQFCYWAMAKPFKRMIPHLLELINAENEEGQKRGAELLGISVISQDLFEDEEVRETMYSLLKEALSGPSPHKKGVAWIFSNNLFKSSHPILIDVMNQLVYDEDEDVQRMMGFFLRDIKKKELDLNLEVRGFISTFAESKSVVRSGYNLSRVLWEQGKDYPEWTLSIVNSLLNNDHIRNETGWNRLDSKDLIHTVMNIYTDPFSDEELQTQAMDTFDKLMMLYSRQAQGLLAEWDRR